MKYLLFSLPVLALVLTVVLEFAPNHATANVEPFTSVELGIAELSPLGEVGGFAMPASGASVDLSFKQTGDQVWDTSASAEFDEDRAVDLKWDSTAGPYGNSMDSCEFVAGARVPDSINTSGVSLGGSEIGTMWNRHLSLEGGSDTYTIECIDSHTGNSHTLSDSADLSLIDGWDSDPECSDGYDNADPEDTAADAADPGCWATPGEPWTYDADDDDESDGGWNPQCSDGVDNDGDGLVDFDGGDPGCVDADDNDEEDDSPTLEFEACDSDGNCVGGGGRLIIDDTDEVTLSWTSTNTDFCDSVSTFTMPAGNPTNYSEWSGVDEPAQNDPDLALIIACGNNGTPEIADVIYVSNPAIALIPHPNPPIIPAEGMPPGDPATVEPIINTYNPNTCYLSGPGLEDDPTIQTMTDDGRLSGGTFDVELNLRGETTYTLICYPDLDADDIPDPGGEPVSDTAIFRILPEVQET